MKIILGSSSPGRKKIMEELGYDFEVMVPDIDEKSIRRNTPHELVMAIAQAKADALLTKIKEPAVLIVSDQVVLFEGKIREKPIDENEAREYLLSYARGPAETLGAVVVVNTKTDKRMSDFQTAKIYFKRLPLSVIEEHIKSGASLRGAGGFLIHDPLLSSYIDHIEGTIDSASGLSKDVVKQLLKNIL
jgi:septum formation protein